MQVFISWSGDRSHAVAKELRSWFPKVIQNLKVFLSSTDIDKGTVWFDELSKALEDSSFGILCLTPENVGSKWVLFESGALASRFKRARMTPLLIGLDVQDLPEPFSSFNATEFRKEDVLKLVRSINEQMGDGKLDGNLLSEVFAQWWPSLESAVQTGLEAARQPFAYDVFLSTPMAAYKTDAMYKPARAELKKVYDALVNDCKLRVFWAAAQIESIADFDTLDVSATEDLEALRGARTFVLVYPAEMVTSALFEAGYALALDRPSHYFVKDRSDLPFVMRELTVADGNVRIHTAADWSDCDKVAALVKKYRTEWFEH